MYATREQSTPARLGSVLLWFGVLGGPLAWAVHMVAVWSTNELTCAAGNDEVNGLPLVTTLVVWVVVPGLVTLAAMGVALWCWRRLGRAQASGTLGEVRDRAFARARVLVFVAMVVDVLFLAIIVLDGVNIAVFPPCLR
jgi:hypothetical protein